VSLSRPFFFPQEWYDSKTGGAVGAPAAAAAAEERKDDSVEITARKVYFTSCTFNPNYDSFFMRIL